MSVENMKGFFKHEPTEQPDNRSGMQKEQTGKASADKESVVLTSVIDRRFEYMI